MRLEGWLAWLACSVAVLAQEETDNEESRKVLGSSVVTSVSVIMDHGNGTRTYLTDTAGQPLDGDGSVGSPVDLLHPDRYEFYTFDETGDLVKRLMTLDQIKGLLATGDGDTLDGPSNAPTFYHDSLSTSHLDDSDLEPSMAQGVHSVVASVQNVLKSELEATKTKGAPGKPPLTIPDSISSWSMLFPAIISDTEALDDGSSSGNSVNEPIEGGDRLTASSNEEKTELKIPQEDTTLKTQEINMVTEKPTVVPPIIHFLEIHSVPSSEKGLTRNPTNFTATTLPVSVSTSKPPTTTDKPTSPVSTVQEMSASISSLMSQVTDDQTISDSIKSDNSNKIATIELPPPTTESVNHSSHEFNKLTSEKTPESSNIEEITRKPQESQTGPSTISRNKVTTENLAIIPTTTEGHSKITANQKTTNKNSESLSNTKKTTDKVVSFITTPKPSPVSLVTKSKPTISTANKQKIQSTTPITPSTIKNVKNPNTSSSYKKPTKPAVTVINAGNGSETLEAHGTEDILKIVPNKQPPTIHNKIKNNQTKSNISSNKPTSKPNKRIPTKPNTSEESPDCNNSKKPLSTNDTKNNDKLAVAASTNLNEKLKPSKIKPTEMQEVKIIQKPTNAPNIKPVISKIKPSDNVKITTYKPSTSQPFTTKQSIHKISTTTQKPISDNKITSASKIHEVNSSLVNIKEHVINFESNKTESQTSSHVSLEFGQSGISNTKLESASLSMDKPIIPSSNTTEESLPSLVDENSTADNIDHSAEIECTHGKKPVHTSIHDKISDISNDVAASNAEEVRLTTVPIVPTTIISPYSSSDTTTEMVTETQTKLLSDDVTTELIRDTATDLPETTTLNMPDVDFVKEGISAVTNILLDLSPPLEPQLPLPTLPLTESPLSLIISPPVKGEVKHSSSSVEAHEMTTDVTDENSTDEGSSSTSEKQLIVYYITTDLPATETVPPATERISDFKNESTESNEDKTEKIIDGETTPVPEETTTTEETEQRQPSESKLVNTTVNKQTVPTKESKLGPENVESINSTIPCNQTTDQAESPNAPGENKNTSETTDYLEPAQSIISEDKINAITPSNPVTTSPVQTTPKSALNNDKPNSDFKTAAKPKPDLKSAAKPDSTKFTQVKYPTVPNAYRPLSDTSANPPTAVELHPAPHESMGLEATTAFLADDVRRFSDLCNELAFRMWTSITGKGSISSRSLVLSPFATTSLLAMVFLGARGPTSGQMNDVLRLDDMVTFNPHQVLQNVTESVLNSRNYGVTTAAFVRELYSDKLKGKILDFYKERAQQYYDGHVEEISFNLIGDILRRRTNLLVKRQTLGKVPEYLRGGNLSLRPPLAAFSANIFQTDCDLASTEGRDGEMYFVVRPSTRQRRLVPVPAAVWRTGFLAGYEPGLDATAVALGTDSVVSTVLVLPGQQGQVAPGDGLARLEQRLIETSYRRGGWTRLLRSLLPRPGLELQVPRFSHRSVLNVTSTLQRMGLKDLFNENKADLRGLNGFSNDLHLSDMVQVNTFSTCGDDTIGARHHVETYPMTPQRMGRDDPDFYPRLEDLEDPEVSKIPFNLRPRQARIPDSPRLRFDRPFLYMVRHNPTGMILHMGRFNPRLLP